MPSTTREEREHRIKMDDGDPSDTVYRTDSKYAESYHGDPDCFQLNGSDTESLTRQQAQRQRKAPCSACVLGRTSGPDPGSSFTNSPTTDSSKRGVGDSSLPISQQYRGEIQDLVRTDRATATPLKKRTLALVLAAKKGRGPLHAAASRLEDQNRRTDLREQVAEAFDLGYSSKRAKGRRFNNPELAQIRDFLETVRGDGDG